MLKFFRILLEINNIILIAILSLSISSCNDSSKKSQVKALDCKECIAYSGYFKIGKSYKINNKLYKPIPSKDLKNYSEIGIASWYGKNDHGKKTANGDLFDIGMLTAAHTSLPLPCIVRVTNLNNQKSLILMVNDRGPFITNRIIDVSEKAAEILGFKNNGISKVQVDYLPTETERLLTRLELEPRHGSIPKAKFRDPKEFLRNHIQLVNLEYKLTTNIEPNSNYFK